MKILKYHLQIVPHAASDSFGFFSEYEENMATPVERKYYFNLLYAVEEKLSLFASCRYDL